MNYTLDSWKQKRNFESTWVWFLLSISLLYARIRANAVMFYDSIITQFYLPLAECITICKC